MNDRNRLKALRLRRAVAAAAAVVLPVVAARASVGYSNLTPIDPLVGDQSFFKTNGAILDDVPIPAALNPTGGAVPVTPVTFGIIRDPNAPAATITGYYGTPTTVLPYPVVNAPLPSFGSASLAAYGGSTSVVQQFTITPASPILVTPNT